MATTSSPSAVQTIATEQEFQSTLEKLPAGTTAIIAFHTTWAAPCKQHLQILKALAESPNTTSATSTTTSAQSSTAFLVLDAEELADISESFNVTAVPFLVIQRDGKVLESVSGADAGKIRAAVERHTGSSGSTTAGGAQPNGVLPKKLDVREEDRVGANEQAAVPAAGVAEVPTAAKDTQQQKEELHQRLAGLVKAAPVMLFMKGTPSGPQCGFSRQLVGILRENGVRYGFFNILADEDVRQGLKEYSDWPTFPQLYVDGELVGGLDIVKEELENDPGFFSKYEAAPAAAA